VLAFNIPINDDDLIEGNEMFTITIDQSSLPENCTTGPFVSARVFIVDNDGKYVYIFSDKFNFVKSEI